MQVFNIQDLAYITLWINICIILYTFSWDQELEIEIDWLKDRIYWEKKQNEDMKKEQKAENMSIDRQLV